MNSSTNSNKNICSQEDLLFTQLMYEILGYWRFKCRYLISHVWIRKCATKLRHFYHFLWGVVGKKAKLYSITGYIIPMRIPFFKFWSDSVILSSGGHLTHRRSCIDNIRYYVSCACDCTSLAFHSCRKRTALLCGRITCEGGTYLSGFCTICKVSIKIKCIGTLLV